MAKGFYPAKKGAALHMADGGMFDGVKRSLGFGPAETVTQKFARQDAERAAKMPKPAAPAAPAPTQPAPQSAISDYAGMSALQRREKEAGLKDGGDLQTGQGGNVPGSGKGDKIPAKYEPGEFVVSNAMLAANPGMREQLHAVREQVLASQGKTPEQADAKNSAVIEKLGAPAQDSQAKGFKPELFFATGGDDRQKNGFGSSVNRFGAEVANTPDQAAQLANEGTAYVAGAQANAASSPVTAVPVPATPVVAPVQSDYSRQMGKVGDFLVDAPMNAIKSIVGAPGYSNPLTRALSPTPAAAPAVASTAGAGRGVVNPSSQDVTGAQANISNGPAPSPAPAAPAADLPVNPGQVKASRQPNGTMAFSGENISGPVSYTGPAGFKPSGAGVTVVPGGSSGSASPSSNAALAAARSAAADRGDFGAVRDSYITQGQGFGGETKEGVASDQLKKLALSAPGTPGRRAAQQMYSQELTNNTAKKTQEAADKLAQQRFGLDSEKAATEKTAAGFSSRASKRIEDLQVAYESAPAEGKAAIAEQLRVLSGKEKPATYKVAAGGQQTDANGVVSKVPDQIYNEQTGQVMQQGAGPTGAKTPHAQDIARLKANPKDMALFEQVYGKGSAKQYLGK